ncbi:MAG: hypothetical protein A3G34_02265 [Candidatus Lindowbacteria bacterium RIFCSPLOWO2_12_FULL_62_27]|nr:MAG: hypothetical protein A3G34_02265 [Candidatus Lindowbacteria bacterium RIFCSPLOWO2_12_FULL_62_27]OGH61210.1 MAG: hypothetical protein A3I06_15525 [Candidatus Lindowbacteria bacterium RIFCSPLOWO2_02_FULL_62_12]
MKGYLVALVCLALVVQSSEQAHAELRKRVLIDVRMPDTTARGVVEGVLAKELGRYKDILVIDERYEQSFLPFMKYKAHVIVQVEVLQMYADDIKKVPGFFRRFGGGVGDAALVALWLGTLGFAESAMDDWGETGGNHMSRDVEGHFVANITLFDMWTERSFARTQTNFKIRVKNAHHDDEKIMLTCIAERGFRDVARWIQKETRTRDGQTWVFAENADRVFVNAGSLDGLNKGSRLKVYRPQPIYAPRSKTVLGHSAVYECDIRIVQVDELFSLAEPVKHALSGEYISK